MSWQSGRLLRGARVVTTLSREMGLTHAEFFRTLPSAMGATSYRVDGDRVFAEDNNRRLIIRLDAQQERRIALLHIPYTWVHFDFEGYQPQEIDAFMAYFESRFQRGGG